MGTTVIPISSAMPEGRLAALSVTTATWVLIVGPAGRPDPPGGPLHLAAALEGLAQGDLVRVLEVAPDREAACQAGNPDPQGLEQPGDVHGGGVPLEVGVGGQDHLS